MPGNTAPIFSKAAKANWGTITTANTAKDGTGTVVTVFTADVTNGSTVIRIIARPLGTNVASVLRIFLNNGLTNATAANNSLIDEIGLPATTLTETAALIGQEKTLNMPIPLGYKIIVTIGTTVAAGHQVTVIGGDY